MNSFKFILNLAMLLVIFLSMKVAATARVPSWKIEPHQEEAFSSFVELVVGVFTVGQRALKIASSKVSKHEKACSNHQYVFILFVFDTFGFLAPEFLTFYIKFKESYHLAQIGSFRGFSKQKRISITTKQKAEPLLVHTNGAPLVSGASQSIRGLEDPTPFEDISTIS
ncbi:transmembrane protein, putative [Medicago truncatula]|uniref:Transmembrane protein, putative n=1 Tax=Medicago truncatula TaxID=3880 RepID=G7IVX1_MEDTR|nr:transmembrane protein, putative [Medicago truncatula]